MFDPKDIAKWLTDDPNIVREQAEDPEDEAVEKLALGDNPSVAAQGQWKKAKQEAERTGKSPIQLMKDKGGAPATEDMEPGVDRLCKSIESILTEQIAQLIETNPDFLGVPAEIKVFTDFADAHNSFYLHAGNKELCVTIQVYDVT